jgi:hypothetical protein
MIDLLTPLQHRKVIVIAGKFSPKANALNFLFRIQLNVGLEMKNTDIAILVLSSKTELT